MPVSQVEDSSFSKEVIHSNLPVLVDFWAPWCGPCRMVAPVVDAIAEEYQDRIKVVKINTDKNPTTATEYGIRSIPTLMIFIKGQRVDTVIGAVPKTTLCNTIDKHLSNKNQSKVKNYLI
uniref:Thioredoxin n=1 Tax=Eucheuma denticulatum TaxID=305493 RepID=A0A8E7PGG8_9FLOR|nr:thioredoxin [Eucheuma denticulatum]